MRRRAVLAALLYLVPSVAKAASGGEQPVANAPLQMAIQFGSVLETESDGTGPTGTIDVFWFPWTFGGVWSEFGVLEPAYDFTGVEPLFSTDERSAALSVSIPQGNYSNEHLEASAGFIFGGTEKNAGYLRAGIGAYRIESSDGSHKVLSNGPPVPYFTNVRWTMGANLAGGARFAAPSWHAQPMFELRAHILPRAEYETHTPLLLSWCVGFWFR